MITPFLRLDQTSELQPLLFAIQAARVGTWDLNIRDQQVWWDERCKELYGFRQDDIVPYDQVLSYIHPDDRELVNAAVQRALDPRSGGQYDVSFRTIGAEDGQLRWLDCKGQAYFDENGQAYRFSGIAQDQTSLRKTRQQLEASEVRFRDLIANSPTGTVVFIGREMVVDSINTSMLRIWGKDASVVGKRLHQALPELIDQPFLELLQGVFDTGIPYHNQEGSAKLVVDGHLQEFWFNFAYNPLRHDDGTIYGVINTATDVTQQVRARWQVEASEARYRQVSAKLEDRVAQRTAELLLANQELKRSNDNLQQFAYIASHDLQEPLRKIQQFGDLLKNQYADRLNEGMGYLERMQVAASRMSTLIKDLLSFSRISTQRNTSESVPLQEVISNVLSVLDFATTELKAHIQVDTLPRVLGDAVQLGQLFQNLISNALKFHRPDVTPYIRISSRTIPADELPTDVKLIHQTSSYHCIEVADNGIGFDEKYLDRIFQVFQRLHSRSQYEGTGIGLAICEKVVINHGGAITAHSQPGQGATFRVYLPA